jgi:hypothetical protein
MNGSNQEAKQSVKRNSFMWVEYFLLLIQITGTKINHGSEIAKLTILT